MIRDNDFNQIIFIALVVPAGLWCILYGALVLRGMGAFANVVI